MMVDPLGSSYPTPEKLQQFFDQVEREVRTVPGVAGRGVVERAAARRFALRRLRADLRDRRRSAGAGGAAAGHQLSGREPVVFLDARSADRRRPRLRRPRYARQPARLHRQRGVRPRRSAAGRRSACGSRSGSPDSPQDKPDDRGDRRRREAGQGPAGRAEGLRADLRADGAGSRRRHLSDGAVEDRPRRRADAGGAGRDLTHRQGAAGQRPRRRSRSRTSSGRRPAGTASAR